MATNIYHMKSGIKKKSSLDIVTSALNEQDNIPILYQRISATMENESNYGWRLIICDNGSTDKTWLEIQKLNKMDSRVLGIRLSRNFFLDNSLTCGLDFCEADAAVFMASDLEDPPEMIAKFLRSYEKGNLHVVAKVTDRDGISMFRRIFTILFYKTAGLLTNGVIAENLSDFRLVDKKVYVAARNLREKSRFLRGIFSWTGYKITSVPFVRPRRSAGKSKHESHSFLFLIDIASEYIYSFSRIPLKIISILGVFFGLIALGLFAVLSFLALTRGVPFAGFGTLLGVILLGFSGTLICVGVLGSYIGLVYDEVKSRPIYVISETTSKLPR